MFPSLWLLWTFTSVAFHYLESGFQYHPDVSKVENAQSHFCNIVQAYEVLGDAAKKSNYDRSLRRKERIKKVTGSNATTARVQKQQREQYSSNSRQPLRPNYHQHNRNKEQGQHYAYAFWEASSFEEYASTESREKYDNQRRDLDLKRDSWRRQIQRRQNLTDRTRPHVSANLNQLDFLLLWIFLVIWSTRGSWPGLVFLVGMLTLSERVASGYKISGMAALSLGPDRGIWLGICLVLAHRFFGNFMHRILGVVVLSALLGSCLLSLTPIPSSVLVYLAFRCIRLALD